MRAHIVRVVVFRVNHCTFPVLQLLLNLVRVHNVHALVSIMEVVACAQDTTFVVALQLGLGRTLRHAATLVVQSRHVQALSLAKLVGNGTLTRLILHHIDLG